MNYYPRAGFTYVEVITVIMILGILGAAGTGVYVNYSSVKEKARMQGLLKLEQQVRATLSQKILGSWALDDGSGTTVKDATALAQHGSIVGSGYQWKPVGSSECIHGGCLNLTGSQYVDIQNIHSLLTKKDQNFTFMAWYKPSALELMDLIHWLNLPTIDHGGYLYTIPVSGGYYLYHYCLQGPNSDPPGGNIGYCGNPGGAGVEYFKLTTQWHLLIVTFDTANAMEPLYTIYIDGKKYVYWPFPSVPPNAVNFAGKIQLGLAGAYAEDTGGNPLGSFKGIFDQAVLFGNSITL